MKESRRKTKIGVAACSSRDGEFASRDGNWQKVFKDSKLNSRRDGGFASRDGDPETGFLGSFVISRILKMRLGLNRESS